MAAEEQEALGQEFERRKRELEEAQVDLLLCELARAGLDELDRNAVARAEEALRLSRRNVAQASDWLAAAREAEIAVAAAEARTAKNRRRRGRKAKAS